MSCDGATNSPTISFTPVPAFTGARMAGFAIPWLQFPHAALEIMGFRREQMLRETPKPFWR